jgi:hypothetical protein
MRVLGVADDAEIGADLVVPHAARHRPARRDVAWTVAVASVWTRQALTVAALPRQAAYPCGPGSVG